MVKFAISPTTLFKLITQIFILGSLFLWETNLPQGLIYFTMTYFLYKCYFSSDFFPLMNSMVLRLYFTFSVKFSTCQLLQTTENNSKQNRFCYFTLVHTFAWSILRPKSFKLHRCYDTSELLFYKLLFFLESESACIFFTIKAAGKRRLKITHFSSFRERYLYFLTLMEAVWYLSLQWYKLCGFVDTFES